jgi:hypothetical protein
VAWSKDASSRRKGHLYWMGPELYGVKWRHFQPLNLPYLHSWTAAHLNRLLADYQASAKRETPTPAGALGCPAQPPD